MKEEKLLSAIKKIEHLERKAIERMSNLQKSLRNYGQPKSFLIDPYSMLDQMGLGFKASPSAISYETMKLMVERDVILSAIVNTRVAQVSSFAKPQVNRYSVGYKIRHIDQNRQLTSGERKMISELERFIKNCSFSDNPRFDNFNTFLKKIVRDSLYYDQIGVEIIPRNNNKPYEFLAVDGSTIRIAMPTGSEDSEDFPPYVQVIDAVVKETYDKDEMIFGIRNPRSDIRVSGYGFAEPEQIINSVTAHLWAEDANKKKFSQGHISTGMLVLKGDIDREELLALKRQWLTQLSGVANAWRNPLVNVDSDADVKWVPFQSLGKDFDFQPWIDYLIRVMTAIYLIDPTEINFDIRGFGGGTHPLFETSNEAKQKWSKDRGLRPLLEFIASMITEKLIKPYNPDFIFEFVGLDAKTEQEAIDLRAKEGNQYKTINELRKEADLPPIKDGDVISLTAYLNKMQLASMGGGGGEEESGVDIDKMLGLIGKKKKKIPKKEKEEEEETTTTETGFEYRTGKPVTEWETTKHASHSKTSNLKKSKLPSFTTFEDIYK